MGLIRNKLETYLTTLFWFYSYLGNKILVYISASIVVGLMDGLGISMFFPLIKLANNKTLDQSEMENFKFLIDLISNLGIEFNFNIVLFFIVFFFFLKGIMKYLNLNYRVVLQKKLMEKLRLSSLMLFGNIRYDYFVKSDIGQIQNTMTGEVDRIQKAYVNYFFAIEQLILITVYLCFAFITDFKFSFFIVLSGVFTNLLFKKIYYHTKVESIKLTNENNIYQGGILQLTSNFKYLKATGSITKVLDRISEKIRDIENVRRKIGFLNSISESAREPILIIVLVVVLFIQITINRGNLESILISLLFFYRAMASITTMQNSWNRFLSVSGSLANIKNWHTKLEQNKEETKGSGRFLFIGKLSLRNIQFSIENRQILENINIIIKKNTTTALIGKSGSGKTTIVNLITSLIEPTDGRILVDNEEVNKLNKFKYRSKIGYITQDPAVFNDSLYNNITLWAPRTNSNEIKCIEAIKMANLEDFVSDRNDNLDVIISNNGNNLSGGQRQRIAIAREIFKEVEILVLDEATSALDKETEKIIQLNLEKLKGKITIIIITHNLAMLKNADNIILLENGKIIQQGSYGYLVKDSSHFKKMFENKIE